MELYESRKIEESHKNMDKPEKYLTLTWGNHQQGQLGLGGIEDEQISHPIEVTKMSQHEVISIACGIEHTLFLVSNGTVYSCGGNECGQLGHEKSCRNPERIDALETHHISQVACGLSHSVALTSNNEVFSWGDNQHGQLGIGTSDIQNTSAPRLVKTLNSKCITQIECGYYHSLALSDNGDVFSWGSNSDGQLGLGNLKGHCDAPQHIACLAGLAFQRLIAGGRHSMALTVSGALFAWGNNRHGQLGVGEKDRPFPTLCKTLRLQRVKWVSCGEEHTAVLTDDGGVFTFGAGMFGQLGHNNKQSELLPRKVFELMGSEVTQIVCGRHHTMAYVPSTGRIFAFGQGGNGQLGSRSLTSRLSPTMVQGPFVPLDGAHSSVDFRLRDETLCVIKRVFAGGSQSFVTATNVKSHISPDDMRKSNSTHLLSLNDRLMREVTSITPQSQPSPDITRMVERIFSSASCLNGSFLLPRDEHYGCTSRHAGVDFEAATDTFSRLAKLPNHSIQQHISNALEQQLLRNLPQAPPDFEALRLYLTLPCCHLFDKPDNFSTIICPFGRNITNLSKNPAHVIDLWWAKMDQDRFIRMVNIYKNVVIHIIRLPNPTTDFQVLSRNAGITVCLNVLKKLNVVNQENGLIICYESFYIPEIKEKIEIKMEYVRWIQQQANKINVSAVNFCEYPFTFDAEAKTEILQVEAIMQMQRAVDEVAQRNFTSMFLPTIDPVNPCLVLYVSRNNLVQDTISQLAKHQGCDFKKPLKVVFLGEEAVDDGGVRKEFFLLLIREILDPKYGMFRYYEDARLIWFNDLSFEDIKMYMLIGILCGLAIYNGTIIDLCFPLALYKKLLQGKQSVGLEDLKELDPTVGRSLQDLLDHTSDDIEDVFCLNFQINRDVFGETSVVDLVPNGGSRQVSLENRKEYVAAYVNYLFNTSVHDQFTAFSEGFHKVMGGHVLELFQARELRAMVIGNNSYNWDEFEQNTIYKNGYTVNSPPIKMFWEVFRAMSLEQKKRFLSFLTGSDRIPIHGMKAVKMIIQPAGGGEQFLPVAHTCFNLMDMPRYPNQNVLREKLFLAIEHAEGFALV